MNIGEAQIVSIPTIARLQAELVTLAERMSTPAKSQCIRGADDETPTIELVTMADDLDRMRQLTEQELRILLAHLAPRPHTFLAPLAYVAFGPKYTPRLTLPESVFDNYSVH